MKFTLYQSPQSKAVMLPGAALKLAGMGTEEKLGAYISPESIVILKENMDAREMAEVVGALCTLAIDLTEKLMLACGNCDVCGLCEDDNYCEDCEYNCSGPEIPPCMLAEAGIEPHADLDIKAGDGKVVITAAAREPDLLDSVPEVLKDALTQSGYCLTSLRKLMESGIDG